MSSVVFFYLLFVVVFFKSNKVSVSLSKSWCLPPAGVSPPLVSPPPPGVSPPGDRTIIMSNTMVIKQPEPVMVLQDSDQWGSRICDCCQDVPECKCLCLCPDCPRPEVCRPTVSLTRWLFHLVFTVIQVVLPSGVVRASPVKSPTPMEKACVSPCWTYLAWSRQSPLP